METQIVSREAWLAARKAHLEKEKALTRARDRLLEERRALPWVRVEEEYVFQSEAGPIRLEDLFRGRGQLIVQHFMLPPGGEICPGCASTADIVDPTRRHFEHADLSYIAVSRAPIEEIAAARRRMGWTFDWVSSAGTSFNRDYEVSWSPQEVEAGTADYNYGTISSPLEDLHGISVFVQDESGGVFHSYSTYARGAESLCSPFAWLDMVPKGRSEIEGMMNWLRLHDEYDDAEASAACCAKPRIAAE